jgi:hypothetical protein
MCGKKLTGCAGSAGVRAFFSRPEMVLIIYMIERVNLYAYGGGIGLRAHMVVHTKSGIKVLHQI